MSVRDPRHDGQRIEELREWRARLLAKGVSDEWTARLTIAELDTLLAVVDERDELRRILTADPDEAVLEGLKRAGDRAMHSEVECTHEAWEDRGGARVCADCHLMLPFEKPSSARAGMTREGATVTFFGTVADAFPYQCRKQELVRHTAKSAFACCRPDLEGISDGSHLDHAMRKNDALIAEAVKPAAWTPDQKIEPYVLPFCDCGSVDKNGDDIGEHGPLCPYHLAVIAVSPVLSSAELDDLCKRTLAAMARA